MRQFQYVLFTICIPFGIEPSTIINFRTSDSVVKAGCLLSGDSLPKFLSCDVLTGVLLKIQFFGVVTPNPLVDSFRRFERPLGESPIAGSNTIIIIIIIIKELSELLLSTLRCLTVAMTDGRMWAKQERGVI
jgi:hypothetical protein